MRSISARETRGELQQLDQRKRAALFGQNLPTRVGASSCPLVLLGSLFALARCATSCARRRGAAAGAPAATSARQLAAGLACPPQHAIGDFRLAPVRRSYNSCRCMRRRRDLPLATRNSTGRQHGAKRLADRRQVVARQPSGPVRPAWEEAPATASRTSATSLSSCGCSAVPADCAPEPRRSWLRLRNGTTTRAPGTTSSSSASGTA